MTDAKRNRQRRGSSVYVPLHDDSGSTLLPMLIGGLSLIVIGAIIVMTFV